MPFEATDKVQDKASISSNDSTNREDNIDEEASTIKAACAVMPKRTRDSCFSPVRVGNKLLDRKPSGGSISNTKTLKQFRQSSEGSAFENTKNAIMKCPVFSNSEVSEVSMPKSISCPFLLTLADIPHEDGPEVFEAGNEGEEGKACSIEKLNAGTRVVSTGDKVGEESRVTEQTKGDHLKGKGVCQRSSKVNKTQKGEDLRADIVCKDLGDLTLPGNTPDTFSPDDYFKLILKWKFGVETQVKQSLSLPSEFFPSPTQEQIDGYTMEMIEIVRDNKVNLLKEKLESKAVPSLQLSNRFGESLIHLACRRGNKEAVSYLLGEAGVSVRCRDDVGRTPFHDCCWNPQPQLEIFGQLLKQDSILLLASDKRNFTPFAYARREHWLKWKEFLYNHVDHINPDEDTVKALFSVSTESV